MAVIAIRMENFMAFADTGWIELLPICLLFGRNSSGKSAVIRALRLLRQSLDHSETGPLVISGEDGIDAGSFAEIMHRTGWTQDECRLVSFGFRCTINRERLLEFGIDVPSRGGAVSKSDSRAGQNGECVDLTIKFGWDVGERRANLSAFILEAPWCADGAARRTIFGAERLAEALPEAGDWWFWSDYLREHESGVGESLWPYVEVISNDGVLPRLKPPEGRGEARDFENVNALLAAVRVDIRDFLEGIEYTGPMRPEPKRLYWLDDALQASWRRRGLGAYLRLLMGRLTEQELELLAKWLERLRLGLRIAASVQQWRDGRPRLSELLVDEDRELTGINIVDLGCGASQVLPVLIQGILAREADLVIIEQPELHLHPGAQADLGDFFIEMSGRGVRFLIETHSEHLLLRLRRRMAEATANGGTLPQGIPGVYFAERNNGVSRIEPVSIDRFGEMRAPEGFQSFFADDLIETAGLASALLKEIRARGDNDENEACD